MDVIHLYLIQILYLVILTVRDITALIVICQVLSFQIIIVIVILLLMKMYLLICLLLKLKKKDLLGENNNLLMPINTLKRTFGFIPIYRKPIKITVSWNTLRKLPSLCSILLLKTLLILLRN